MIKPTLKNLLSALELCAKAHNVEFKYWEEDGQAGVNSESVPVSCDVKTIVKSFYPTECVDIDVNYGWNNIWLYEEDEMLDEVDEENLATALPNGLLKKI